MICKRLVRHPGARLAWRAAALLLASAWLALAGSLAQAQERVALLLSERGGHYSEFIDAFYRALNEPPSNGRTFTAIEMNANADDGSDPRLAGVSVVVAVGVQAMRAASGWDNAPPTLNVLVPRTHYERVVTETGRRRARAQFSAIYLDQPVSRQLNLLHELMPGKRRVATVLGPDSEFYLPRLRAAVARSGHELVSEEVSAEFEVIPALTRLLGSADVFLALPDSVVFTRESARSILLTSYRYRKPLVGFSQAYVSAGALAAVFSTPSQIARQTVDILRALPPGRSALPAPTYPTFFSIAVNRAVARSFALKPPADGVLHAVLASQPEGE
ncbi:ABC transporter substrate-binding protein [Rhodocyclus gracilis]|uniref:ABC transporter substrate-binding protein n=1 Tax=Rhodocyclus tenuis TaxID=1066 RepID=A0A6L5JXF7_RHOTE|nr:hypothetical protein [Rhodocyclus gracilis]MQY52005.1 hypothetical protein [Rhodocyclus gracilis]